jgi:hypothetical protein
MGLRRGVMVIIVMCRTQVSIMMSITNCAIIQFLRLCNSEATMALLSGGQGDLQGNTQAPYLFIIFMDYIKWETIKPDSEL